MSEIIPAILATSVADLTDKLNQIPKEIKLVHIDVLEQDFWTDGIGVNFEAHLMVREPAEIIDRWVTRGAKRIIVHTIKNHVPKPVEIGLGVELHTPLEEIFPFVSEVDFLNLMSIAQIGAQGHPFEPRIFDRIKRVKEKFPQAVLSIDGGINTTNYQALRDAGAERLVVGSGFKALWNLLTKK